MATLTTALEAEFTPGVGPFNVQSVGGQASLLRKGTAEAPFASVGEPFSGAYVVDNSVAGAVYKFSRYSGSPVVQADQ